MSSTTAIDTQFATQASKDIELTRRFTLAMLADPSLVEEVPDGVLLELLPDDDPDHAAVALTRCLDAVRTGRNVYFRHVRMADLPA